MPSPTIPAAWAGYTDWQLYLAKYNSLQSLYATPNHELQKRASIDYVKNFYPNFSESDADAANNGAYEYYNTCIANAGGSSMKEGKCLSNATIFWPGFNPIAPPPPSSGNNGGNTNTGNNNTGSTKTLTDSNISTNKNWWIIIAILFIVALLIVGFFLGWISF